MTRKSQQCVDKSLRRPKQRGSVTRACTAHVLAAQGRCKDSHSGIKVEAGVNLGTGGATQGVMTDWAQGAQCSLLVNAVNVVATYNGGSRLARKAPCIVRSQRALPARLHPRRGAGEACRQGFVDGPDLVRLAGKASPEEGSR